MKKTKWNDNWMFSNLLKGTAEVEVTLPHDAMQTEERLPDIPNGGATGYYPGGKYQYKKVFSMKEDEIPEIVFLEFEGVYQKSEVYLNEEKIGGRNYGYSDFLVDLTGKLKVGENTVTVIADNTQTPNSRWYSGSGIYRDVYLHTSGASYIKPFGITVTTESIHPALLHIKAETEALEDDVCTVRVSYKGNVVAEAEGNDLLIEIPGVRLWSDETPELYDVEVSLNRDGKVIDTSYERVGIRQISWSGKDGFQVNGKTIKLRGGCIHHDNAFVGAASFYGAELRRVRILKENGFNAVRYAHNPAGKAFLDACDELGMYVMNETFDVWNIAKSKYDYSLYFRDDYEKDIFDMVKVSKNHPSVVAYTIGNEIQDNGLEGAEEWVKKLCDCIYKQDTTRPITQGLNTGVASLADSKNVLSDTERKAIQEKAVNPYESGEDAPPTGSAFFNFMVNNLSVIAPIFSKISKPDKEMKPITKKLVPLMDIAGYNYGIMRYSAQINEMPDMPVVGTETYVTDIVPHWAFIEEHPQMIGEFIWAAWDYLGEAGIGLPRYDKMKKGLSYPYPAISANSGCIDLTGHSEVMHAQVMAVWHLLKKPVIGVRPPIRYAQKVRYGMWRTTDAVTSWTWHGYEGKDTEVQVYAQGEEAELLINGKSYGRKKLEGYKVAFKVKYVPGEVQVHIFDKDGKMVGESALRTAGNETILKVCAEQNSIVAREKDVAYVNIALEDQNGILKMSEKRKVRVEVAGSGSLVGLGSANPLAKELYSADTCTCYNGRVLAIVRANGEPGNIHVKVSSEGLETVECSIKAE